MSTFHYQLQGTQERFETPADPIAIILDHEDVYAFDSAKSLSVPVLAYISIGEWEDYRAYQAPLKDLVRTANVDWPGNYIVDYTNQRWQDCIREAIKRAYKKGFDGVYLDTVDTYERVNELAGEKGPGYKTGYALSMVKFVESISRIDTTKRIVPQNGEGLLDHKHYADVIDGIGIEDLFFTSTHAPGGTNNSPALWTGNTELRRKEFLNRISLIDKRIGNKQVFCVEYELSKAQETDFIDYLARNRLDNWATLNTSRTLSG